MRAIFFSTALTLLRGPLALLFLFDDPKVRIAAILLAMATDVCDGFLARRFGCATQFGAFLDPLMDKFFALFAIAIFIQEGSLAFLAAVTLLSRDIALFFYALTLTVKGAWRQVQFRSVISGKIATALQFFVFIALALHFPVPVWFYVCFSLFGPLTYSELYLTESTAHSLEEMTKKDAERV